MARFVSRLSAPAPALPLDPPLLLTQPSTAPPRARRAIRAVVAAARPAPAYVAARYRHLRAIRNGQEARETALLSEAFWNGTEERPPPSGPRRAYQRLKPYISDERLREMYRMARPTARLRLSLTFRPHACTTFQMGITAGPGEFGPNFSLRKLNQRLKYGSRFTYASSSRVSSRLLCRPLDGPICRSIAAFFFLLLASIPPQVFFRRLRQRACDARPGLHCIPTHRATLCKKIAELTVLSSLLSSRCLSVINPVQQFNEPLTINPK